MTTQPDMLNPREREAFSSETAIMTIKDVIADTKLGESTIYQLMTKGTFPTCFNLIGRKTVWLRSEIETWKKWRIEEGKGGERWEPPDSKYRL